MLRCSRKSQVVDLIATYSRKSVCHLKWESGEENVGEGGEERVSGKQITLNLWSSVEPNRDF